MEPRKDSRANGHAPKDVVIVTRDELERLVNPLSVVHGYTQLLRRELRRGQSLTDEDLLKTIDRIADASQILKAHIEMMGYHRQPSAPSIDPE